MKFPIQNAIRAITLATFLGLGASGCGGTSTGNPLVEVRFSATSVLSQALGISLPGVFASPSDVKVCIRRLRFKTVDSPRASMPADHNVDFEPGEVSLNVSDLTTLGLVVVPPGVYRRIEFDLAPDANGCVSKNSISFTNTNGSYSSGDPIMISFRGIFVASGFPEKLTLSIQAIMNSLNTVSGPSGPNPSIRPKLTNTMGSF